MARQDESGAGALVEVVEIGGFEAEVGPDRGCGALSRARNRICLGNHRQIRHRAPRRVALEPTSGNRCRK